MRGSGLQSLELVVNVNNLTLDLAQFFSEHTLILCVRQGPQWEPPEIGDSIEEPLLVTTWFIPSRETIVCGLEPQSNTANEKRRSVDAANGA